MDEELALASATRDSPKGQEMALVNVERIVFDYFREAYLDGREVESVLSEFVAHMKGHELHSVERAGDSLAVSSANPAAVPRSRTTERLTPRLYMCPFCSFVAPCEELHVVHSRSYGFI